MTTVATASVELFRSQIIQLATSYLQIRISQRSEGVRRSSWVRWKVEIQLHTNFHKLYSENATWFAKKGKQKPTSIKITQKSGKNTDFFRKINLKKIKNTLLKIPLERFSFRSSYVDCACFREFWMTGTALRKVKTVVKISKKRRFSSEPSSSF